jgi:hypothetical protein
MFQSYKYIQYKDGQYQYEITDDDFVDIDIADIGESAGGRLAAVSLYDKRKLNVPLNVALCIRYYCRIYGWIPKNELEYTEIHWADRHPQYLKYIPGIKLYLEIINDYPKEEWERVKSLKVFL